MSSSTSSQSPDVLSIAREYVSWEPNASSRSTIQSLIDAKDTKELTSAFLPRIAFGTAGLRARMSAGYHNMNDLVIIQTTQGFARYILAQQGDDEATRKRGIIIGYDGRHNSRHYAEIVASIFLALDFTVHLFSRMCGTPFVPFGVTTLKTCAGIMITASHNPKEDNGYKVYWNNGAQIIAPHDTGIAEMIEKNMKPWHLKDGAEPTTPKFDAAHPHLHDPFESLTSLYFTEAKRLYCWTESQNKELASQLSTIPPVTYTAMHGVGAPFTRRAVESFGLPALIPTPAQMEADPEFPTVKFPNPEEGKGALALAMQAADAAGSRLILANDPDADRLAVAEKVGDAWFPLNGNQIAAILADYVFRTYVEREKPTREQLNKTCMVASTVSSQILAAMAKHEGFQFYPTLTGFKWMGNRAYTAVQQGERFLFAYEVEIGFLVGSMSYDKDGIRTAAIFYEAYAALMRSGKTCHQRLDELYQRYGYFNMNTSYFFVDPSSTKLQDIFARLRNFPQTSESAYPNTKHRYPTQCGGVKITSVRDVTYGYDNSEANYKSALPIDTSASMLTFRFENGCTATLRNSGTEPKLKYYIECSGKTNQEAADMTKKMAKAIIDEFIQPVENQLEAPKVVA